MLEQKVISYIGFARRKKAFFIGNQLEDKIVKNQIYLLVILPSCSKHREEHYQRLLRSKAIVILDEDIEPNTLGLKKPICAFGISDINLAGAIKSTLLDTKTERRKKDEQR